MITSKSLLISATYILMLVFISAGQRAPERDQTLKKPNFISLY